MTAPLLFRQLPGGRALRLVLEILARLRLQRILKQRTASYLGGPVSIMPEREIAVSLGGRYVVRC